MGLDFSKTDLVITYVGGIIVAGELAHWCHAACSCSPEKGRIINSTNGSNLEP